MLESLQSKLLILDQICDQKSGKIQMNAQEILAIISYSKWLTSLTEGSGIFVYDPNTQNPYTQMKLEYDPRTCEFTSTLKHEDSSLNEITGIHALEIECIENPKNEKETLRIIRLLVRNEPPIEYKVLEGILP